MQKSFSLGVGKNRDFSKINVKLPVTVYGGPYLDELCERTRREKENQELEKLSNEEIGFARRVAHTDKKRRNKAFDFLKKWLMDNPNLQREDFLRLWKSVFYAFWLCDKYKPQLKLAVDISLLSRYVNPNAYKDYLASFFYVLNQQWELLDKHRIDKFLLLCRVFHAECFSHLHRKNWDTQLVQDVVNVWTANGPLKSFNRLPEDADNDAVQQTAKGTKGAIASSSCTTSSRISAICSHFVHSFISELSATLAADVLLPVSLSTTSCDLTNLPHYETDEESFLGSWSNPHLDTEEMNEIRKNLANPTIKPIRNPEIKSIENPEINPKRRRLVATDSCPKGLTGKAPKQVENAFVIPPPKIPKEAFAILMTPFFRAATECRREVVLSIIHEQIFRKVTDELVPLEDFAKQIFLTAASKEIGESRRSCFYETLEVIDKKLKELGRSADYISCIPSKPLSH